MEIFHLEPTDFTPGVTLNHEKNSIEFYGESRPEDINSFFNPINDWIEKYVNYVFYIESLNPSTISITTSFKLDYFNSSSAKKILDLLKKLTAIEKNSSKIKVNINWYYDEEDEDMLDTGKEYQTLVGHSFNFIQQ